MKKFHDFEEILQEFWKKL